MITLKQLELQCNRYPGYVPGTEFCIYINLVSGPTANVIKAAPGTAFQWAITGVKIVGASTGAAYSDNIQLINSAGAPAVANVKWFDFIALPAAVGSSGSGGDGVSFPPDDPILMGANNPVNVWTNNVIPGGDAASAIVKGYLVAI